MKRVELIGHDSATANAFVGLAREVTVDYENWELRLHDGETPGGHKILNRDLNDDRYQARSVELDGLLGWDPSERGILVRLGPSNYALRQIQVNTGQLKITNPNGFGGNFQVAFADDITTPVKISGELTTTTAIKANAGVIGDVQGNTFGIHTGDVEGDVEGNVTGDLLGNTFGVHTGGLDTTGGAVAMADGQIQLSWLNQSIIDFIVSKVVPIGGIIQFNGLPSAIPANWRLCDGTGGTPDLRNRFIIGSSDTLAVGDTGGATTHSHGLNIVASGSHSHSGTVSPTTLTIAQMPAHKHGNGVTNTDADLYCYGTTGVPASTPNSIDDNSSDGTLQGFTETIGGSSPHDHGLAIDMGGSHSHAGTTGDANHLPPYYVLAFIRRMT